MSDLIDRRAAIEKLRNNLTYMQVFGVDRSIVLINELPSAQPEIIRCKDCKKYDMHDHRCKHWNHGVVVMDWCSKAERRQA